MALGCSKERKAFAQAEQKVADAAVAFYIAENNFEAAIWGSGAADIKMVKEVSSLVRSGSDKLAAGVLGLLEAIASNRAAQARIKAAQASYEVAKAKREKARVEFETAQAALDKCLAKRKKPPQRWSGQITQVTKLSAKWKRKGSVCDYSHSQSESATTSWTIVAPKSPDDASAYLVQWSVQQESVETTTETPHDRHDPIGPTDAIHTSRGSATGIADLELDYDDRTGLRLHASAPAVVKDARLITDRSTDPKTGAPFTVAKGDLFISTSPLKEVQGKKLTGELISGAKQRREAGPPPYTVTISWKLRRIEVE